MSLTFVTPVAPYHTHKIPTIEAIVKAQTIPCEHIIVIDHDKRGAGWARNEGLRQVSTQYVSFLDADDSIDPSFAEKCISVIRPRHYVYSAWWAGGQAVMPEQPCVVWTKKTAHIVTTVMATSDALNVGWDEVLPAIEDVDFYLALISSGVCPIIYPEPLFTYGHEGQRSKLLHGTPIEDNILQNLKARYKGFNMACCNGQIGIVGIVGEQQAGDELFQVTFGGNRNYWGRSTGRFYGRIGAGKQVWMSLADAEMDKPSFIPVKKN